MTRHSHNDSTKIKARLARVREDAIKLRERIKQSTARFYERCQAHVAWWQRAFRVPLVGFYGWVRSRCSSLWAAMLMILGLSPMRQSPLAPRRSKSYLRHLLQSEELEQRQLLAADITSISDLVGLYNDVSGPASDIAATSTPAPTISGTATNNATVSISNNGDLIGDVTVTANGSGNWTYGLLVGFSNDVSVVEGNFVSTPFSADDAITINASTPNTAPTATNLSALEVFTNVALNLTDIVVTDPDTANTITATLTLSTTAAGTLSTATSGTVTSTFSAGVWTASGPLANVNTLLAGVAFTPATNSTPDFSIATSVSDGVAPAVTGTKPMKYAATKVRLSGGDLFAEDTDTGGNANNDWSFGVTGNAPNQVLVIYDNASSPGAIGIDGTITGATYFLGQLRDLRIPLTSFTSLVFNSFGGTDSIALGALNLGNNQNLTIDGGAGVDNVQFATSQSELLGAGAVSVTAESLSIIQPIKTAAGNVTLIADSIDISGPGAINTVNGSVAGIVTFQPQTSGRAIKLEAIDSGSGLSLSDGELDKVSASMIKIGNATSGAITVSDALTSNTNLALTSDSGGILSTSSGSLQTSAATALSITLNTPGAIGTSTDPLQIKDESSPGSPRIDIGTTAPPSSVFLKGQGSAGSVTLGTVDTTAGSLNISFGHFKLSGNEKIADDTSLTVSSNVSVGTFKDTVTNLTLVSGLNFSVAIGGTAGAGSPSGHGQIKATGTVALGGANGVGGANLVVSLPNSGSYTPVNDQTFMIVDNAGSGSSGTFNGLAEGGQLVVGGTRFKISYVGGNGNDVVLTVNNNAAPVLANIETASLSYTENDAAKQVTNSLTVSDDGANIASVTVSISAGFSAAEDVLAATVSGITANYNAGVLTLTGPASKAAFESVLRTVTYFNSSNNPSTTTRTISFVVNDGEFNSNILARNITVTPVNDPGSVTISDTTPDVGQLLTASVTDADGLTGVTITYLWQRADDAGFTSGVAPVGTNSATFTPTSVEANRFLRVTATYTDQDSTSESVVSSVTAAVTPAAVNLSVDFTSGTEVGTTLITVTATANANVNGAQTVNLGVTGTGITMGDYTLSNSTITIADGSNSGSVTFAVKDDLLDEGNETATLTISSVSSGLSIGTTHARSITIIDDDNAGASNFTLPATGAYRVVLNSGDFEIRDSLNALVTSRPLGTNPVVINGTGGNDSLTIDYTGGNITVPITFNGGSQTSTNPGDSLTLTGGTFATGTFAFTNANDGTIILTGNALITYTGLEPIVTTGTTINDLILTFNGGAEMITLTDATGANMTIDSTLSESVTFANPNGSLTINAGTGNDIVTITSVDAAFNVDLTINGDADNDTVNLNGDITFASGESLIVNAESVTTAASADLTTSGAGVLTITADDVALDATSTLVSASIVTFKQQTVSRAITLGTEVGGSLSLTDTELDRVTAGTVQIGNASSGAITVSAAITHGSNLSLTTTAGITVNSGSVDTGLGNQTYNGAVVLGANTTLNAKDVTFNGTVDSNSGGTTLTFQQGANGYVGARDTYVSAFDAGTMNTNYSSANPLLLDGRGGSRETDILIGFDALFGNGAGQIPLGSTIVSASLSFNLTHPSIQVIPMLVDWPVSTITFNNATLGTNTTGGIQADGVEATSTGTVGAAVLGRSVFNVGSHVQNWSNGAGNFGWYLQGPGTDTTVTSSEAATVADRPLLSITAASPTRTLLINTSGDTTFNGVVGNGRELQSITINSTGSAVDINAAMNVGGGGLDIDAPVLITVNALIASTGGDVSLIAKNGVLLSGANADVTIGGGAFTVNADSDADLMGTFTSDNAGSAVSASGGAISIIAADVVLTGTLAGTSTATIAPSTAGSTIGIGGGTGTFNISDAELALLTDGFSLITIGTGAVSTTETFSSMSIPAGLETFGPGLEPTYNGSTVTFTGTPGSGQKYLRTQKSDYDTSDFVAEVSVFTAGNDNYNFFGLGSGSISSFNNPYGGVNVAFEGHYFGTDGGSTIDNGAVGTSIDSIFTSNQTHRIRLAWNATAKTATFSVDQNYTSGPFVADYTFAAIDGSNNGFNGTNGRLFFGGAQTSGGNGLVYDNFTITQAPAVDVDSSTFLDPVTILGGSISVTELNAGSNAITLIADGGAITDGGNAGADVITSTLTATAASGIGATDAIETIVSTLSFANTANAVQVTNTLAGGVTVSGTNAGTGTVSISETSGNLTVGAADIVTNSGAVNLTASALNKSINSASGSNVQTTGGSTAGAAVTWAADNIDLSGNITAGTGVVTLKQNTNGTTIDVGSTGGPTNGNLELSDAELDRITAGTIQIGDTNSGAITVTAPIDLANASVLEIITGGDITETVSGNALSGDTLILMGDLAPALTGRGTFEVDGPVIFDSTASYEVNLNGTANYDQLIVAGTSRTITLGGAELVVTLDTVPAVGSQEVFRIVDSTGTGSTVSGTFKYGTTTLNDGDTFTVGSNIFRINYNPSGAAGDVTLTEAGNTPPVVDLNGTNDTGSNFTAAFVEDAGAVNITDTDATITDTENTTLANLKLVVSANPDGAAEIVTIAGVAVPLSANNTGTGIVGSTTFQVAYVASTRTFTITKNGGGNAPIGDLQTLLRGITYNNTNDTPNTNARTIAITANDGIVDSSVATATITVTAVNDAPTLTTFAAAVGTTNEDTEVQLTFANLTAQGDEADVDGMVTAFVVQAVSSGTLKIGTSAGSATAFAVGTNDVIDATNNAYWTPALNASGTSLSAFTVKARDNGTPTPVLLSATSVTVPVSVTAVNDAPTLTTFAAAVGTTNEDTEVQLTFANLTAQGDEADLDGMVTAFIVQAVSSGTLKIGASAGSATPFAMGTNDVIDATNNAYWTPALSASGTSLSAFTVKAQDNGTPTPALLSATSVTVPVSVTAVNDAPVARDDTYTINEDASLSVGSPGVKINDTDDDNVQSELRSFFVTGPSRAAVFVFFADGSFYYVPWANFYGQDTFTYKLLDVGLAESNIATVTITINPLNDAPVAVDDAFIVESNSSLSRTAPGVITNDSDVDDLLNTLTANRLSGPTHGTLSFNSDGSFNYTPDTGFTGVDEFFYQLSDPHSALSNSAKVTLNVTAAVVAGKSLFYNNSSWDGNGITLGAADSAAAATDKAPLLPGQTATYANYTNYSRGINGLAVDIRGLATTPTLATVDSFFSFKTGRNNLPAGWAVAPKPTGLQVIPGGGVGGADRVLISWLDGAIKNTWLEVVVLSNPTTGLANADRFYFGNAIGETGDSTANASVNATDVARTQSNFTTFLTPASITNRFDFDRDKRVNATDVTTVQASFTTFLTVLPLITPPTN